VDEGVDFAYSENNGKLVISGEPYWITIARNEDGTGCILVELKDTALTRQTNPTVYDSMYRVAKYSAFFKYLRDECGTQWKEFTGHLSRGEMDTVLIAKDNMPHSVD